MPPSTAMMLEDTVAISDAQLTSLDDTDAYATAWAEALKRYTNDDSLKWGGRGQGGRGTARRTRQPHDVVLDAVRLEYVGTHGAGSRTLLDNATLKLLSKKVYALIGHNGSGKSSLLLRIHAGKIPGFPPHLSTLYIPQDVFKADAATRPSAEDTPLSYVLRQYELHSKTSQVSIQAEIQQLEDELENLDMESENDQHRVEELGEQISHLEDSLEPEELDSVKRIAEDALKFMEIDTCLQTMSMNALSPGMHKKIALSLALMCPFDLLLLDEPANHLDVPGLIRLRQIIHQSSSGGTNSTVLLVSHDRDLINDVATDVVCYHEQSLLYAPGNYDDFLYYKQQGDLAHLRQAVALEKKRSAMVHTLDNLKKQAIPKRGGAKKKGKQIEAQCKIIERVGLNRDPVTGHKWKDQKVGTGIKPGSINAIDASARRGLTTQQLLKQAQSSIQPPPDKAIQFQFRSVTSQWGEPLISAMEVGQKCSTEMMIPNHQTASDLTKEGFLYDYVDMSIDEGGRYCILGNNGVGKSVLLKTLARLIDTPDEGNVVHATNLDVGYLDESVVKSMFAEANELGAQNGLALLSARYPQKTEQDIRGELTAFGLSPQQALTDLKFLSGGERRRLCLANLMLGNPQVLLLDQPTANLDMESVEALSFGLSNWNGTVVMVSHDASFVRSLEPNCFALVDGKLQRVPGGIDAYLKSFG